MRYRLDRCRAAGGVAQKAARAPEGSIMEGRSKLRTATDALMATIIGISRRLLVAAAIREAVGYS